MKDAVEALFERQIRQWPLLARGVEGLAQATTRPLRIDWFEVFARHIPHRVASTTARVDKQAIAGRPCFLCARNLPAEEEGLRFNQDFTIYCNPFPIVERHLTIVHAEHRPQLISGHFGTMLDLAAALPGYFVIYNGPECGASAPDHLHFQAGSRKLFPIQKDLAASSGIRAANYKRNLLLLRRRERAALIGRMERILELLYQATGRQPEPLVNIAVFHHDGEWTCYLFPRQKHRPAAYESGVLTVSPASIDLCGIFVVPIAQDFAKITGEDVAAIFQEVTLPDDLFHDLAGKLEKER